MPVVRVRQHVNPLSQKYQHPVDPPAWETIYGNQHHPLHLDIGCGRGQFLLQMAQHSSDWNFLGLEIREPLVAQANRLCVEAGLTNLHYIFCNANNSLSPLLASLGERRLQRVTIQFPDPWFKKRHQKRRMVQPMMIDILAEHLVSGGMVFLQSDIEAIAAEMGDRFLAHPAFALAGNDRWLSTNPLPVPTERETQTLLRGEPVYRMLLMKS